MVQEQSPAAPTGRDGQPPAGGAQQPPVGEPDGSEPRPPAPESVSRAELDKVIGERQAAKDRARKAEAQAAELRARLQAMPDAETLEAFDKWMADRDAQERDRAIRKGDVAALEQKVRRPLEEQIGALQGRNKALEAQVTALLRDQALKSAATAAEAVNPDQVVALLRDRVTMTESDDGRFVPDFRDADGQPLYDGSARRVTDVDTLVRLFLAAPENANLVRATARPGSGAKPHGGGPGLPEGIPRTLEEYHALGPDQQLRVRARMTPDHRKALLGYEGQPQGAFL